MIWNNKNITNIIQDMISENPLACSALLNISEIEFTEKVETMAVSLVRKPTLYINLNFCNKYLQNDNDVKALLLHEFLHVLLQHTIKYDSMTPMLNIALDAIINAIIFRTKGMEYANFFVGFYKWEMISFLLRPKISTINYNNIEQGWLDIHEQIYKGKYCADDLYELLDYLKNKINKKFLQNIIILGDHSPKLISKESNKILDETLKKMDGTLIWNTSGLRGNAEDLNAEEVEINNFRLNKWKKSTIKILKKCFLISNRKYNETSVSESLLPIINNSDKRAYSKFIYNKMIPLSRVENVQISKSHFVNIYLDVSGSMNDEISELVGLLYYFKKKIQIRLLVFSNYVSEANFINGKLQFESSGGTSISAVFDHIRENKINKSLIITDGYIETIEKNMLIGIKKEDIKVLISSVGDPAEFNKNKIQYLQLEKL